MSLGKAPLILGSHVEEKNKLSRVEFPRLLTTTSSSQMVKYQSRWFHNTVHFKKQITLQCV